MLKFRTRLPNKLELSNYIDISLVHTTKTGDSNLGVFKINPSEITLSKNYWEELP